jgi:hypothetical protein
MRHNTRYHPSIWVQVLFFLKRTHIPNAYFLVGMTPASSSSSHLELPRMLFYLPSQRTPPQSFGARVVDGAACVLVVMCFRGHKFRPPEFLHSTVG